MASFLLQHTGTRCIHAGMPDMSHIASSVSAFFLSYQEILILSIWDFCFIKVCAHCQIRYSFLDWVFSHYAFFLLDVILTFFIYLTNNVCKSSITLFDHRQKCTAQKYLLHTNTFLLGQSQSPATLCGRRVKVIIVCDGAIEIILHSAHLVGCRCLLSYHTFLVMVVNVR